MNFNDFLRKNAIDPVDVYLLRHSPKETKLKKALPWLAAERHDLFNAYQQTQTPVVEKALAKVRYVASFIGVGADQALFAGLYAVRPEKNLSYDMYWRIPAYKTLKNLYDLQGFQPRDKGTDRCIWFDMTRQDLLSDWIGRMVITWPGGTRSWARPAKNNENMHVFCIHQDSQLVQAMPAWNELVLSWADLSNLPQSWKQKLMEWRGVYFIQDQSDGRSYVGSAYGRDNIWGRWENYARSGHGNNTGLKGRNPEHFLFSILERVSPDLSKDDTLSIENKWKERLHTRGPWGLNNN